MSEKAPASPERLESHKPSAERSKTPEKSREQVKHKESSAAEIKHMTDKASEKAKNTTEVLKTIHSEEATKKEGSAPTWTNPALISHNYRNIIRSTQRKLGSFDKTYSKIIHNPVIEKVSETSAKTIARPPAFLGGALASLIGSSIVLYVARRNGFTVSPIIFVILFLGGYITGLVIDLLINGTKKATKR